MHQRHEVEQLRRSIAMLTPGTKAALGREEALDLLRELHDVGGRLERLQRELRRLADESG